MNKDKNYKKNLFWNMVASIINAAEAVIVIMVVSRVNEREASGILTIAFSLANLLMMIGKFGMKNYQISHDGYDVVFDRFFRLRIITVILMALAMGGYLSVNVLWGKYSSEKAVIILCVCVWYVVEAFEDVFVAHLQAEGQLHVGNKLFIFRWTLILSAVVVVDIITGNLILALILADIAAVIAEIIGIIFVSTRYRIKISIKNAEILTLLVGNLPLCVSDLSYYYLTNVSKYVIDRKMDDLTQAVYGYIAMPVFVISLLNSIIYQPKLMGYVADIRELNISSLVKKIIKQVCIIVMILSVCLVGAFFLGIPVLSWLYNMNLSDYKAFLLLLVGGGAALALGGYFQTVLILIGKRKTIMFVFLFTAVVSTILTVIFVDRTGLSGAVYGFIVSMVIMSLTFLCILIRSIYNLKKKKTP